RPALGVVPLALGVVPLALGVVRLGAGVARPLGAGVVRLALGVVRLGAGVVRLGPGVVRLGAGVVRLALGVVRLGLAARRAVLVRPHPCPGRTSSYRRRDRSAGCGPHGAADGTRARYRPEKQHWRTIRERGMGRQEVRAEAMEK
ncbi:MAG: hypothetical protein ACM3ML_03630, partial [Micromonosporaceae bacterium]